MCVFVLDAFSSAGRSRRELLPWQRPCPSPSSSLSACRGCVRVYVCVREHFPLLHEPSLTASTPPQQHHHHPLVRLFFVPSLVRLLLPQASKNTDTTCLPASFPPQSQRYPPRSALAFLRSRHKFPHPSQQDDNNHTICASLRLLPYIARSSGFSPQNRSQTPPTHHTTRTTQPTAQPQAATRKGRGGRRAWRRVSGRWPRERGRRWRRMVVVVAGQGECWGRVGV